MGNFIQLFVMIFLVVFLIYEFVLLRKYRAKNKKKTKGKEYPTEVQILINFYKVDVERVNYKKLLHLVAVVSSFDISLLVSVLGLLDSGILQIILAIFLVAPVIFISYYFIALFYNRNRREEK